MSKHEGMGNEVVSGSKPTAEISPEREDAGTLAVEAKKEPTPQEKAIEIINTVEETLGFLEGHLERRRNDIYNYAEDLGIAPDEPPLFLGNQDLASLSARQLADSIIRGGNFQPSREDIRLIPQEHESFKLNVDNPAQILAVLQQELHSAEIPQELQDQILENNKVRQAFQIAQEVIINRYHERLEAQRKQISEVAEILTDSNREFLWAVYRQDKTRLQDLGFIDVNGNLNSARIKQKALEIVERYVQWEKGSKEKVQDTLASLDNGMKAVELLRKLLDVVKVSLEKEDNTPENTAEETFDELKIMRNRLE